MPAAYRRSPVEATLVVRSVARKGCMYCQQGQRPPATSPQRGGARGGAAHGSGAGCTGDRPLAERLPTSKVATDRIGMATVVA
ncbi:hypothetical protein B296_00048732 [Ensete ventricosum]|uniref:Uncharacterized protein n=1 Tax=Ensete ventricosum TaxID=4639 RepID=A0A426X189_ENSVE|nr:hypothetical protein B296_00048732 [Ensete ventricosum]